MAWVTLGSGVDSEIEPERKGGVGGRPERRQAGLPRRENLEHPRRGQEAGLRGELPETRRGAVPLLRRRWEWHFVKIQMYSSQQSRRDNEFANLSCKCEKLIGGRRLRRRGCHLGAESKSSALRGVCSSSRQPAKTNALKSSTMERKAAKCVDQRGGYSENSRGESGPVSRYFIVVDFTASSSHQPRCPLTNGDRSPSGSRS
ncbi:hypothetical protein C8R45DRAFT_921759 [Mycena sanguinolenta]|nr:hypothetical protein C8R45DRAFT_921759 [Mycena sanguinolenta]